MLIGVIAGLVIGMFAGDSLMGYAIGLTLGVAAGAGWDQWQERRRRE